MSGKERAAILFRISEAITRPTPRSWRSIESLEVGKTLAGARGEMNNCADLWHFAAGLVRGLEGSTHNALGENALGLVLREPIGVVGVVTPWNYPLVIASERLPWALGAGCTVVLKPSEFTSGSTLRLGRTRARGRAARGRAQRRHRLRRSGGADARRASRHRHDRLHRHRSASAGRSAPSRRRPSSASGSSSAARGRWSSSPMPISMRRPSRSPAASSRTRARPASPGAG